MGVDKKITLIRDNQTLGEIFLLCAFNIKEYDNNYIVYARDNTTLNDNSNIVYFGKIITKDDLDYLVSINNEEELTTVKEKIKQLFKYSIELETIKKEKINFNKKVEIPKNLFTNPYNEKVSNRETKNIPKYQELDEEKAKDNREYRNRLKSLSDDIQDIKPIDKYIPDTLYVNYYNEMGMLLKSKLSTLKQLWIEYQLLYNEKQKKEQTREKKTKEELRQPEPIPEEITSPEITSDFDSLFNSLSKRIEYINDYLDELRELKEDIENADYTEDALSSEREKLKQEKKEFEEYKKQEQEKISTKKEELQIHFNKFQSLVENFDKKIKEVK
jgi:hypothetical protein